ncbi:MAG: methylenetetrahydrofolate reductase [Actinomycetota bacterium]|nr:methylenetetrahydrofolate reductase [Actinomycetota bacterium]
MTRIADLLAKGPTYSFEFFPPKTDAEQTTLVRTLRELEPLSPSFVSVTYRGGAASRQRTHDLVAAMLQTTSLVPMAHLVCVAHSRLELADILVAYRKAGVENLMALGGDTPVGPVAGPGELRHAVELVELARAIGGFSIGVAAHPAGHPDSPDLASDRRHLAQKLTLADFAVTQFFWEVDEYRSLVDALAALGCTKPVLPGVMPLETLRSVPRMAQMGAAVPDWLVERLQAAERSGGADGVRHEGVAVATELCRQLLAADAPGLHFYTMNRSSATREIYAELGLGPAAT